MDIVGIHLDCKYLANNKRYLVNQWLPEIAQLGVNTLVIEYEDKFPWQKYPFLRHREAWSPAELRTFLTTARKLGLRLVPLVQSLGHLEFALAHPQLAVLRELPDLHNQICPRKPAAVQFVKDLITEVLAYHQEDDWFHLGADEAWFLGACPACKSVMTQSGALGIWLAHQQHMTQWILDQGKRPIVWDDIFWRTPEAIFDSGLPKETILCSWDYSVTSLEDEGISDTSIAGPDPVTGKKTKLRQVEIYRQAGHDVLAGPCHNWGTLIPRHEHGFRNAETWAAKARQCSMLGVISTSWASLHVPLALQQLQVAATAELFGRETATIDDAWQVRFLSDWFGTDASTMPEALRQASVQWEVGVAGLARPLTLLPYGYMDLILHYPGGHGDRRRLGCYPLDWEEIDHVSLFARKIEHIRSEVATVRAQLDALQPGLESASSALRQLVARATRHQAVLQLYATMAELKALSARVIRHQVLGEGDHRQIGRELSAMRTALEHVLAPCFEPTSIRWCLRMWWEPQARLYDAAPAAPAPVVVPALRELTGRLT